MKSMATYGVLVLCLFAGLLRPTPTSSANLTTAKDTLQTSRLSWGARVDSTGTVAGSSLVKIQAAPTTPYNANNTANLKSGDSLTINANTYTVASIIDADEFTVSPVVAALDAVNDSPIQMRVKPQHVIQFNTATAVANGFFRVLIPADTTTSYDNNIDDEGYDFTADTLNQIAVAASDVAGYDFVTGVSTRSGQTNCTAPTNYHCFEVHYSGAGAIGTTITITIGNTSGANSLISPTEVAAHTLGIADTYPVVVSNYAAGADPNTATAVDDTTLRIAQIESVRVTVIVEPTISFTITGVASGQTRCGVTTDVSTTAAAVPFGSITLFNSFYDAAHNLMVSINASSGYVVTASENDELSIGGLGATVIPDTVGDAASASETTFADWDLSTTNGFGYSIDNNDAASVPFQYSTTSGACAGTTYCAKQFANRASAETEKTIFSSSTVANAEDIDICYRLSVDDSQTAGDYQNQITYTATATF